MNIDRTIAVDLICLFCAARYTVTAPARNIGRGVCRGAFACLACGNPVGTLATVDLSVPEGESPSDLLHEAVQEARKNDAPGRED